MKPNERYSDGQFWGMVITVVVIGGLALMSKSYELLTAYPVESLGLLATAFFTFSFYAIFKDRK